jgi:two-component system response regulator GlrR
VNCASLPPSLFENELFGHSREAFTDAKSKRLGLVQEAKGGSIFFDEVNTLDPACQAKLLRFIEEREYRPLGARKPLQANLNVIAASNNDLQHHTETGRFREDLFYRLNVITLILPPLRERREDIPLLVKHFLKKYEKQYGIKQISPDVLASFSAHEWPGNIRQLENMIQQLMILTPGPVIDREHLPTDNGFSPTTNPNLEFQKAKKRVIEEFEKNYIIRMLRMHQGNITHTAKAAGKDRRVFARMIKKYRISADAFKSPS